MSANAGTALPWLHSLLAPLAQGLASGWLVDAVIALLLLEGLALLLWHRLGRGPSPRAWWPMLAAGLGLLLTLRTALAGAPTVWPLACLAAAGAAHARDLWLRCRRADTRGTGD
jgi:hypothetical protein